MFITIGVIIAIVLYGVFIFWISHKAGDATGSHHDFAVAGRNVGSIALLGTMCLSIWSALAFFGYGAGLYRDGIGYFAGAVGAFFVGIYAPTIMYRLWLLGKKYNYVSPGDYFIHRYESKFLKYLISIICIVCIIPYISVQVTGVANGIVTTTQGKIGFWVVVAILTVYIVLHVLKGGNKAVVGTDTFAGFVGVGIAILTTIVLIVAIPGDLVSAAKDIVKTNPEVLQMTGPYATFTGFLALAISAGMSIIAWPHIFVRSYMARDEKVFKTMGVAFPILELVAFGCFLLQGIYAGRVAYPNLEGAESDIVIPMMALNYAPAILAILLVIGVFAFGLSTADSQLVVASTIIDHDMIGDRAKKDGVSGVKVTQISIGILMILVLIVVKFRPAFLVTYAYGFSGPGFAQLMPAMIGGLYWKRATKAGAISGTLAGALTVLFTLFVYNPLPSIQPILWGLGINTLLYIVVSLFTKPVEKAVKEINEPLSAFFATRNTAGHKVLLVLIVLVFIQLIVLSPYMPATILFGWCPAGLFNYICGAIELAVIGYFFCKNRLYEKDGSKKEF